MLTEIIKVNLGVSSGQATGGRVRQEKSPGCDGHNHRLWFFTWKVKPPPAPPS